MKRSHLACVCAALLFAACGDDDKTPGTDTIGGGDTSAPADTLPADTTPPPAGTSAITGVSTAGVTCTEPTPNASCTGINSDGNQSGFSYPWCGLTTSVRSYTCNGCPFGRVDLQGNFRAMKDGLGEPPVMDFDSYKEVISVDGNTFYIKVRTEAGTVHEARGWFMCANRGEQVNEHQYWVITEANPPGATWFPGAVLETDHVIVHGTDKWFTSWYDDVGASTYLDMEYCKIGSTIFGVACTDPFAN